MLHSANSKSADLTKYICMTTLKLKAAPPWWVLSLGVLRLWPEDLNSLGGWYNDNRPSAYCGANAIE